MIRLGGPVFIDTTHTTGAGEDHGAKGNDPDLLVRTHKSKGYKAAYAPQVSLHDRELIRDVRDAFKKADIAIAEVGYWTNPFHLDPTEAKMWRDTMLEKLALADELGACCAVCNLGSFVRNTVKFHNDRNFTIEAFDRAVQTAQELIDSVKPTRTYFTYEMYPFGAADSPENVHKLIDAVDRERFAVHMDLVNLVNCPRNYFRSGDLIRECIRLFGPKIVSAHAKDLVIEEPSISVLLHETRPGTGNIDYAVYLGCLNSLPREIPLMMEHMQGEKEYDLAAEYIRDVAKKEGIVL